MDGAINLKLKNAIVLSHWWKTYCKGWRYKIVVAGLVKLSKLISWLDQKNKGLFSEPKLERNSSLQEWKKVYLEQDAAFLSRKHKKVRGEEKAR